MSQAIGIKQEPVIKAHGTVLNLKVHNGKIGMWLFLGSEIMFFTGMIGAYIVLRNAQPTWPDPTKDGYPLDVFLTAINTFFLICSSVTLVAGLQAYQRNEIAKGNLFTLATALIGTLFVSIQAYEYIMMWGHGTRPNSDLFSSCFYTMTGFHGFHVFWGVVAMYVMAFLGFKGRFGPKNYLLLELTGLYWHFVDLVWIILFPIVYLM